MRFMVILKSDANTEAEPSSSETGRAIEPRSRPKTQFGGRQV